ncbi:MAG: type VI secretion system baseplate subunit TssK [Ignavibacteriota bacterium]
MQFQLHALNFRPWGFRRLRIDQSALATGTITISEASGILSDGLLFDIPESDAAPLSAPHRRSLCCRIRRRCSLPRPFPTIASRVSTWRMACATWKPLHAPKLP